MTIHSFCQSVLKQFPVEAGLPPHFQLMDEQNAIEYLTKCLHNIIEQSQENSSSVLAESFKALTLHLDANSMSELMQQIISKRSLLAEIFKHHGDAEGSAENTIAGVYKLLGVDLGVSVSSILQDFYSATVTMPMGGEKIKISFARWKTKGMYSFIKHSLIFVDYPA